MKLFDIAFSSRGMVRVLRIFAKSRDWLFNLTELSRDLGMNKGAVSKILKELERENIIVSIPKGRITLFQLNRKNRLVKETIIPVFEHESGILKTIEGKIVKPFKSLAISVILYGSYARNEFDFKSDIDVMIITENKNKKLAERMAKKTSEDFLKENLSLVFDVISIGEFKKLYKRKEPLILDIIKNGRVLSGKGPGEIL